MRWSGRQGSQNIEDRRGIRYGKAGGIGIGTIVLALIAVYFGQDPSVCCRMPSRAARPSRFRTKSRPKRPSCVNSWRWCWPTPKRPGADSSPLPARLTKQPTLVLFSGAVESACGFAQAAVGPFYCPADHKVYIDLSFYQDLQSRFGAPGDFAQAYVIAHEVGHHVQTLLGISERNMAARQRASEAEANALSVRQELQADCFAGIWAHNADRSRAACSKPATSKKA